MGSMKVGVIAAEMEGRSTGVGRYLEGLLGGLERWRHGVWWHLFFQGDPHAVPLADGSTVIPHTGSLTVTAASPALPPEQQPCAAA